MKVTGKPYPTATLPTSNPETNLFTNPPDLRAIQRATTVTKRRARNPSLTRQRRSAAPGGRRSRPETPLLKWKVEDRKTERGGVVVEEEDDDYEDERETSTRRKDRRKTTRPVSVRKLAAGLWRLQVPDAVVSGGERKVKEGLGFQGGVPYLYHHSDKPSGGSNNRIRQNPSTVATTKNGFLCTLEPSMPFPHSAMEGATKWDPVCMDTTEEVHQIYSNMKRIDQQVNAVSLVTSLETELEEAHARIEELESEKRSHKKKLEQFLRKVSEERAAWRSREHEKVRAIIDDMKADMSREKKTRQRLEIVNHKLVNELADSKLAAKRYMQDFEKERKARGLALLGFTGDLIIDEREQLKTLGLDSPLSDESTFKLAPDISFIQPSERDLIERLIKLGFYYRELDRFANKSRNLSWIRSVVVTSVHPLERADELSKQSSSGSSEQKKPSVYRRAVANGIVEILSVYRSAVLHIEQKLLAETTPILATVTQGLNKFFLLFPPLYEVVLEIERDDIRGGQLLNVLNKRCHCGVPELRACLQRLLWHGHQVMYNQLAAWMVYGILQDPHEEFFIKRQEDGDLDHRSSQEEISDKLARTSVHETSLTDWHSGFHISLDMLPDHIPMRLGESVLFAGKAIRVLRNPSPAFQFQKDKSFQQTMRGSQRIRGFMHSDFSEKETELDADLTGEELLPQSEADKIEAMLKDLKESSEFHKRSFECTVDSVRAIAASHLWQLVVVRADLNGHLKALKDYFLLEKGDFFQCFLEESRQLMRFPPRQSTGEADLMVPFQLAATKTIGEEDKYFSRVSLRLPSFGVTVRSSQADLARSKVALTGKAKITSDTSVDGWDAIALEYSVDWPMQLFFTQEVLSKYLKVFQYLIRLKRTQMELEKSWASVMHQDHMDFAQHRKDGTKESISQQRRQGIRPMWRVREHMAFLIRNLQFYIQVDVIESQWKVLQTHIHDSQDFTELVGFHQEYLSALISQSFLDIGAVSRILDSIMKLCLQFCWNIENHESNPNTSELENIAEEFNQKSNSLYTILRSSKLAGSQRAPFLRRFLLRLNFNSFYEATTRGLLNVVRQRPALPL